MPVTAEERKVLLKSQQGELESVRNDEQRHGDTVLGLL